MAVSCVTKVEERVGFQLKVDHIFQLKWKSEWGHEAPSWKTDSGSDEREVTFTVASLFLKGHRPLLPFPGRWAKAAPPRLFHKDLPRKE